MKYGLLTPSGNLDIVLWRWAPAGHHFLGSDPNRPAATTPHHPHGNSRILDLQKHQKNSRPSKTIQIDPRRFQTHNNTIRMVLLCVWNCLGLIYIVLEGLRFFWRFWRSEIRKFPCEWWVLEQPAGLGLTPKNGDQLDPTFRGGYLNF